MTGIRSRPDSLAVGVMLAAVGGYLDAYTFIRFRVFANAQTGNVVLFGIDAASRDWDAAVRRLAPVAAFVVGVIAVEVMANPRIRRIVRRPLRLVLSIEVLVLAIVATLPDGAPETITTVSVALAAAMQFSTFRVLGDTPYTTLLASGNLRSAAVAGYQWVLARDRTAARRAGRFSAVVGAFAGGAVIGAWGTQRLGVPAVAVAAGLLLVVLVVVIRVDDE
jgi:uncharacterized membrane protein YoaK (UPF0700 family)